MAALKKEKEKQINLLPTDKLSDTTFGRVLLWFLSTFRVLVIIVELFVISAFLSRFWLDAKNSDLSEEIKQKEAQIKAMRPTEEETRSLQKKTEIISLIFSAKKPYSEFIKGIVPLIPPDVNLSSISFEGEKANILGLSKNEAAIQQFLVNLESSSEFKNPTITQLGQDEENDQMLKFGISVPISKE